MPNVFKITKNYKNVYKSWMTNKKKIISELNGNNIECIDDWTCVRQSSWFKMKVMYRKKVFWCIKRIKILVLLYIQVLELQGGILLHQFHFFRGIICANYFFQKMSIVPEYGSRLCQFTYTIISFTFWLIAYMYISLRK